MVTVGHGKRGSQSTEDRNGRQQILGGLGEKNASGPTRWPDRRTSRSSQRVFLGRPEFVDLASAEVRLFGWLIILPVVSPNPRKTESDEAN